MDEEVWGQIVELERATFNWGITDEDMAETRGAAEHPRGVMVIAKGAESKILGYMIGYPGSAAYADISGEDPNMLNDDSTLYVMTVAVKSEIRGVSTFTEFIGKFIESAREKGYLSISAHTPSKKMPAYERLMGAEPYHEIADWCDTGEPHTYWVAWI